MSKTKEIIIDLPDSLIDDIVKLRELVKTPHPEKLGLSLRVVGDDTKILINKEIK